MTLAELRAIILGAILGGVVSFVLFALTWSLIAIAAGNGRDDE